MAFFGDALIRLRQLFPSFELSRHGFTYAINPWTTHSQFIVSHALLRDEQYAAPLRDWLDQHRSGSMLVLDEAHHAAPATSSSWAVDSDFTRQMRELTPQFEHRLFLSATPHNGQHLRNAIELGRLCSNDPVCAQHSAKQVLEERFLLGAACHGCLLISKTSCERFNQHLGRSLVVATIGGTGAEFFSDQDLALP